MTTPVASSPRLRPRNLLGAGYLLIAAGLTGVALTLSASGSLALWLPGQLLLAVALLQWFVLMHEAGHNTLFRGRRLNQLAGHVAGFFALIPFSTWRLVHGMHHRWTGWQDLDMTTATLVPRPLSRLERVVVDICWRGWLPLFSLLYRLNNFWNLPRLFRSFPRAEPRRRIVAGTVALVVAYGTVAYLVGPVRLLELVGLGLFLCLVLEDPLILSQHTHVPMRLSSGETVAPFAPREQEVFTRSLRFPAWFSTLILLHFDAHELHHVYPRVPGYHLRRLGLATANEVSWWRWLRQAKRVPGSVFLFQNRDQSGYDV